MFPPYLRSFVHCYKGDLPIYNTICIPEAAAIWGMCLAMRLRNNIFPSLVLMHLGLGRNWQSSKLQQSEDIIKKKVDVKADCSPKKFRVIQTGRETELPQWEALPGVLVQHAALT